MGVLLVLGGNLISLWFNKVNWWWWGDGELFVIIFDSVMIFFRLILMGLYIALPSSSWSDGLSLTEDHSLFKRDSYNGRPKLILEVPWARMFQAHQRNSKCLMCCSCIPMRTADKCWLKNFHKFGSISPNYLDASCS